MKTTKKEKAIKEINIKELKANYRTAFAIVIPAMFIIGIISGYFVSIVVTDQARSDWITAQNSVVLKASK